MLNNPNDNTSNLEQRLDDAGQSFRDRCAERPPDAPEGFIDAVNGIRAASDASPGVSIRNGAALLLAAASLALLVTFWPGANQPKPTTPETGADVASVRGLNPLSAGALRLRNLDRPLDDPDLPSASIVNWVARTNPLGP
jgi:hypothetical protein